MAGILQYENYWYFNKFTQNLFTGAEALTGARFGEGTGRVWLDTVQCSGSERALVNCESNSSGVNSCTHSQDAAVRCTPGNYLCSYTYLAYLGISSIASNHCLGFVITPLRINRFCGLIIKPYTVLHRLVWQWST